MTIASEDDRYLSEEEVDFSATPQGSEEIVAGALQDDPELLQAFRRGGELVTDSLLRRVDVEPAAEVRSAGAGEAAAIFVTDLGELASHTFSRLFSSSHRRQR